jgi:hypothetical protein
MSRREQNVIERERHIDSHPIEAFAWSLLFRLILKTRKPAPGLLRSSGLA